MLHVCALLTSYILCIAGKLKRHCLSFCDEVYNNKDTHKDKYKDKDEENDRDKELKIPMTCSIFEKLGVQGYQI